MVDLPSVSMVSVVSVGWIFLAPTRMCVMEMTRSRTPHGVDEHAAWTIPLGELVALLNRMPELSPELRTAIVVPLLKRIRENSR